MRQYTEKIVFQNPKYNLFDCLYEGEINITGSGLFARAVHCDGSGYIGHYNKGRKDKLGIFFKQDGSIQWQGLCAQGELVTSDGQDFPREEGLQAPQYKKVEITDFCDPLYKNLKIKEESNE